LEHRLSDLEHSEAGVQGDHVTESQPDVVKTKCRKQQQYDTRPIAASQYVVSEPEKNKRKEKDKRVWKLMLPN
jgi:hypothetical protein